MKKLVLAGLMLTSMNVFSSSYLILGNGVTLTTDKAGFVYDFGHFTVPYKVTLNGGQFFAEDKKLNTIDSSGFLYDKDKKVEKVKGKGINYLINDDKLITIDAKGFYYEFDKDSKSVFKKAVTFGGTFFLVKPDDKKPAVDLYTVNDKGNYFKVNVEGLNPATITVVGGNYFQTADGVTYTISKDGFVFNKADLKAGPIKKAGGNFFIDAQNRIYTVTADGFLMLPILPANIVVAEVQKAGANYMIDSQGKMFTVDTLGNILERAVNHDLLNAKVLSF